MTVFIVLWGFTCEVESVHATQESAEARVEELGAAYEVREMPVLGVEVLEILEIAA